jgi:hypothetical protein
MKQSPQPSEEQSLKMNLRRAGMDVLKTVIFALALLYLADYFGWDLLSEAGGRTTT